MNLKQISSALALLLLFSTQINAQSCLVNQLTINTGYDPVTNATIPVGNPDPNWVLTDGTPAFFTASGAILNNNAIVNPMGLYWTATNPNSRWISYDANGVTTGSAGYLTTANSTYEMHLTRTFRLCADDQITFDMRFARDNYIVDVLIDNSPAGIFSEPASQNSANIASFTAGTVVTQALSAGTHEITVIIGNFGVANTSFMNPHGVNIVGTITGTTNSIVGPNCPPSFVCEAPCEDKCFWKVTGNNILNGNNIFGTLTNDNVRVQTNGLDRGTFSNNGLLGWNTMVPTAYLHINCNGHNPNNGAISDVRFEKLETGKGDILVIDENGYVYDSQIRIDEVFNMAKTNGELKAKNEALEIELNTLKNKVDAIFNNRGNSVDLEKGTENTLFQNTPNPFDKETSVRFDIKKMSKSASIVIYDLNGKELLKYPIERTGVGAITVNRGALASGMYLYALIVDGQESDTKRMVLTD